MAVPEDLDDKAVRSFSCFTGKTGMIIIRAIIDGERDPGILAEHRDSRCKKSVEDIEKSLKCNTCFAIFGGLTPVIAITLISTTGSLISPSYYLAASGLCGLLACYLLQRSASSE